MHYAVTFFYRFCIDLAQFWWPKLVFVCCCRLLTQFAFNLSPQWEIAPPARDVSRPLKDGVKDMLVKYHLFSWDI